jgi:uncharacterized protein (DUF2062 family)
MAEATPTVVRWVKGHIPTRDTIHHFRLLRPFAHHLRHPSLWRLNRRSVPRGVALGLFVGVIIPFMHTFVAALLAIPARANVAVAALLTLVVNPLTIPFMYIAAYRIGAWELNNDANLVSRAAAERFSSELGRMLFWVHHATGPIAVGVLTLAASAALIGYLAARLAWTLRSSRRWRRRHERLEKQSFAGKA